MRGLSAAPPKTPLSAERRGNTAVTGRRTAPVRACCCDARWVRRSNLRAEEGVAEQLEREQPREFQLAVGHGQPAAEVGLRDRTNGFKLEPKKRALDCAATLNLAAPHPAKPWGGASARSTIIALSPTPRQWQPASEG